MALDIEPNDTPETAVKTNRLGSGGFFNEDLAGTVSSLPSWSETGFEYEAQDASDWWRMPISLGVLSVRLESITLNSGLVLLKPGTDTELAELTILPSGSLAGPAFKMSAAYGSAAYGEELHHSYMMADTIWSPDLGRAWSDWLDYGQDIFLGDPAKQLAFNRDKALYKEVSRIFGDATENAVGLVDYLTAQTDIHNAVSQHGGGTQRYAQLGEWAEYLADLLLKWPVPEYSFEIDGARHEGAPQPADLPAYFVNQNGADGFLQIGGFAQQMSATR